MRRPAAAAVLAAAVAAVILAAVPAAGGPPSAKTSQRPAGLVDPLALDLEMAEFLVKHVPARREPRVLLRELMNAIFGDDGIGITYDDRATKTAVETFESGSGNCLSFTLLFVGLARHLGLDAYFREVDEVLGWDQRGGVVLSQHHMFAEVEIQNASFQVDFLQAGEKRYRRVLRISDERARAHYFNNLGVEALTAGRLDDAAARFREAIDTDPRFAFAWTNLGVAQRRLGDPAEAERSHRRALELDAGDPTALANLASLYLSLGRADDAAPLLRQADDHLQRNPFHHFAEGDKAMRAGDYEDAVRHFREAVRRQDDEPEFQAALDRAVAARDAALSRRGEPDG